MEPHFDPRQLPDGGRSLAPAVELCAALALLDGEEPRAWRHCRGAALRYVEVVRAGRFGPMAALDLLRRAVATWVPRTLPGERRTRLEARLPFWVGTVYGLRWRRESAPASERPRVVWRELQSLRAQLVTDRDATRRRLRASQDAVARARARTEELIAAAAACMARSQAIVAMSHERLGARATGRQARA